MKEIAIPTDLVLKGIFFSKGKPSAIINDKVLGIGQKIGISTVMDIKSDKVILNNGSQDFELKIQQQGFYLIK